MIVSVDAGYGWTKCISEEGRFKFPSLIGEGYNRTLTNNTLDVLKELHISIDDEDYFIGDLAQREGIYSSPTFEVQKIHLTKLLILSAIATLTQQTAHIELITGLPISHYKTQRKRLYEALRGSHKVKLLTGKQKDKLIILHIRDVLVFPQSAGAYFSEVFDCNGKAYSNDMTKGLVAVLDIGYKTTDFCTLKDMNYIDTRSGTLPVGISDAHKSICRRWNEEGKEALLGDVEQNATGDEPEFRALAQQIQGQVRKYSKDAQIYIAGGGAIMLERYLQGRLLQQPEYANAAGFYKIGLGRWEHEKNNHNSIRGAI